MFDCGLITHSIKKDKKEIFVYIKSMVRQIITLMSWVVLSYFIFTIDEDGEETVLDQVKDFTALVIIVEIDNMVVGYSDTKTDDLDLYKFKDWPLEEKFNLYVKF